MTTGLLLTGFLMGVVVGLALAAFIVVASLPRLSRGGHRPRSDGRGPGKPPHQGSGGQR